MKFLKRKQIPFTYEWIMKSYFNNKKSILDIGTGNGELMSYLNDDKRYDVTGVELFVPYIKKALKTNVYKEIMKQDVTGLKIKDQSYDIVFSSQVLEHLKKNDGYTLIKKMEKAARKMVILGTPNGHLHQDEYDGNHLQKHLSAWSVKDLKEAGFRVHGQGLKLVYGDEGLSRTNPAVLAYLFYMISFLLSPLAFFIPQLGAQLIAVKKVHE